MAYECKNEEIDDHCDDGTPYPHYKPLWNGK